MPFIKSVQNNKEPVKIYYEDWGKGKPVVFIHGWPLVYGSGKIKQGSD